jgi:hypothetical protein
VSCGRVIPTLGRHANPPRPDCCRLHRPLTARAGWWCTPRIYLCWPCFRSQIVEHRTLLPSQKSQVLASLSSPLATLCLSATVRQYLVYYDQDDSEAWHSWKEIQAFNCKPHTASITICSDGMCWMAGSWKRDRAGGPPLDPSALTLTLTLQYRKQRVSHHKMLENSPMGRTRPCSSHTPQR